MFSKNNEKPLRGPGMGTHTKCVLSGEINRVKYKVTIPSTRLIRSIYAKCQCVSTGTVAEKIQSKQNLTQQQSTDTNVLAQLFLGRRRYRRTH